MGELPPCPLYHAAALYQGEGTATVTPLYKVIILFRDKSSWLRFREKKRSKKNYKSLTIMEIVLMKFRHKRLLKFNMTFTNHSPWAFQWPSLRDTWLRATYIHKKKSYWNVRSPLSPEWREILALRELLRAGPQPLLASEGTWHRASSQTHLLMQVSSGTQLEMSQYLLSSVCTLYQNMSEKKKASNRKYWIKISEKMQMCPR